MVQYSYMALSPRASAVWNMCEAYVPIACEHLTRGAPKFNREGPNACSGEAELSRIVFLFPRFPEEFLMMLAKIRMLRWQYGQCKRADAITGRQDPSLCPEQLEAAFDASRNEIEKHLLPLSPVQQEIIRETFLTLEGE